MNPQTNSLLQMNTDSTTQIGWGCFFAFLIAWFGELFFSNALILKLITTVMEFIGSWIGTEWIVTSLLVFILLVGFVLVGFFFALLPVSALSLFFRHMEAPSWKTTLQVTFIAVGIIAYQYAIFSRFGITWWSAVSTILLLLSAEGYIWLWLKNRGARHSLATTVNE